MRNAIQLCTISALVVMLAGSLLANEPNSGTAWYRTNPAIIVRGRAIVALSQTADGPVSIDILVRDKIVCTLTEKQWYERAARLCAQNNI